MTRIKIKHPSPYNAIKLKLLRTLSEDQIYAIKIISTPDSYVVLTRSADEIDKIFQVQCLAALRDEGFEPIIPPELRAKRIIIIFNVDEFILSNTESEIKELINENGWITGGIKSIFKIPKARIMKFYLKETTTAKTATQKDMLVFHMSILAHNIKLDEFIPILTCMRCYKLEDHTTNNCPMPKDYTVCSECGCSEHTWKNCNSDTKKCLNCLGPHRTLANICTQRKEIKDNKRKEEKQKKL